MAKATDLASPDPSTDFRPDNNPNNGSHHVSNQLYEMPLSMLFVRSTPEFTEKTVPVGLLGSHQLAAHLWARLNVLSGRIRFTFEEPDVFDLDLEMDQHVDIPPLIHHHVLPLPGGSFSLSFFRTGPTE